MFDIGWSEILVIGVVALVVIGPKELPRVLRSVGQGVSKLRRMAGEFQGQFNEALREAELSELKNNISDLKNNISGLAGDARESIAKALPTNPLQDLQLDLQNDMKAPTGVVERASLLPPEGAAQPAPASDDLATHSLATVESDVKTATVPPASAGAASPSAANTPPTEASPVKAPRKRAAAKPRGAEAAATSTSQPDREKAASDAKPSPKRSPRKTAGAAKATRVVKSAEVVKAKSPSTVSQSAVVQPEGKPVRIASRKKATSSVAQAGKAEGTVAKPASRTKKRSTGDEGSQV